MRRVSMGNWFNTATGIACQFNARSTPVQDKDPSRHLVSRRLREFGLKAHTAVSNHQQNESKG